MKIILISDTHSKHELLKNLPEADVIIHAGDFTTRGLKVEVESFAKWFSSLPYKHKIFIAGNHELSFESHKSQIRALLTDYPEITYLQDNSTTIEGVKIYGSPWSPKFHSWAFNAERGPIIRAIWDKIPLDTDILVVHGPPHGYGDLTVHGHKNVGCQDLLERVLVVKPKLCIFGHIHEGYGMYTCREDRNITMINASVVDEHYYMINEPILIEYEDFT